MITNNKNNLLPEIKTIRCNTSPLFNPDKTGYFIIKIFPKEKEIRARHFTYKNKATIELRGRKATHLYKEIIERKLVSKLEHAAYLGKELMKAEYALKNKKRYLQN